MRHHQAKMLMTPQGYVFVYVMCQLFAVSGVHNNLMTYMRTLPHAHLIVMFCIDNMSIMIHILFHDLSFMYITDWILNTMF